MTDWSLIISLVVLGVLILQYVGNLVNGAKRDTRGLYKELTAIKIDISELKIKVDQIIKDVDSLKQDVSSLKQEVSFIKEKQISMDKDIDSLKKDSEQRLQLNLFESHHRHAHLQLTTDQQQTLKEQPDSKQPNTD